MTHDLERALNKRDDWVEVQERLKQIRMEKQSYSNTKSRNSPDINQENSLECYFSPEDSVLSG